jgi:DNA polymerase III epsilon subunit-like protein
MNIIYDFETSTSDFLGQILSYAFVVTDDQLNIIDTWKGTVKLNRTQIAEPGAILTNKLNIDSLNDTGKSEYDTAKYLQSQLDKIIATHGEATLIGFNSNQFDLQFLRNTLLRYGLNPYFKGKLHNIDVLHWIQAMAFENEEVYPWTIQTNDLNLPYYSFTLEATAKAFGVLKKEQSHDAEEDVLLLIELIKEIQNRFGQKLSEFYPISVPNSVYKYKHVVIGKQKVRHFPKSEDDELSYFHYRYWLGLDIQGKAKLMLDLEAFEKLPESPSPEQLLGTLKYINDNKHMFRLEPLNYQEEVYFGNIINQAANTPFIKGINLENYFKLTEKDWDIEYQIHQLGFERIDTLHAAVSQIIRDPEAYDKIINRLWSGKKTQKDRYLVQLFNRAYLALHPSPKPEHLAKYMAPRYLTGTMMRDPKQFVNIDQKIKETQDLLQKAEHPQKDLDNLTALLRDIQVKRDWIR